MERKVICTMMCYLGSGGKRKAEEDIRLLSPSPQLSPQFPDTTDFGDMTFDLNSLLRFSEVSMS